MNSGAAAGAAWSERAVAAVFLACVCALGLTQITDTDTWTHLAFGRWIWEHRAIPGADPFISAAEPFPYNNWLFGLGYYLAWLAGGAAGAILLKAAIVGAIFALLLREALRPWRNLALAVLALGLAALLVRGRFVERPDTVMMLALAFGIHSLGAYVREGSRLIYALPLVHLVWANAHTSIALMAVPFVAWLAGGALQSRLHARLGTDGTIGFVPGPTSAQLKTIALVFGASFLASLASPYGFGQYLHSVGALASDWWRQEVLELQPPDWQRDKPLYLFAAAVALSFLLNRRRASLVDLAMAIPFLALPFSARRFVWFAAIGALFLARNLAGWLQDSPRLRELSRGAPAFGAIALLALAATSSVLRQAGPLARASDYRFGFGIDQRHLPEGALRYMDERGIGGRVFNIFQWGGYVTWRDFPRRQPLVDGRGFLRAELLEQAYGALRDPPRLDEVRRRFGFEAILFPYPRIAQRAMNELLQGDLGVNHPGWALVYWDDISLLYLRRGGAHDAAIARDEYRFARPAKGIERARLGDAEYRRALQAELERNIARTGSSVAHSLLGTLRLESGEYQGAIDAFAKVGRVPSYHYLQEAHAGSAEAHARLGRADEAIRHYQKALALRPDAGLYQKLAQIHAARGEREAAIAAYGKALESNRSLVSAYRELAKLYEEAGRKLEAEKALRQAQEAQRASAGEEHFKAGTQAYLAKNFPLAIAEFEKSIAANPASPMPYSNLGYLHYDLGDLDKAYEYHRRALDIDAGTAISHYGLALVFAARGDAASAIAHWEEYLKLEPAGYYSRRAKEQIAALRR